MTDNTVRIVLFLPFHGTCRVLQYYLPVDATESNSADWRGGRGCCSRAGVATIIVAVLLKTGRLKLCGRAGSKGRPRGEGHTTAANPAPGAVPETQYPVAVQVQYPVAVPR